MKFHRFRNCTCNFQSRKSCNRRGNVGSGILFFVFFLMMFMIAGGLVGASYAFFGKGYESRDIESKVLFSQVKECFDKNDFFEKGFVEHPELFYEKCRLDEKVLNDGNHLVYVKRISDGKEFFVGVYDFTTRCGLDARRDNRDLPLCYPEISQATFGDYEILVASSQNSRRVSA